MTKPDVMLHSIILVIACLFLYVVLSASQRDRAGRLGDSAFYLRIYEDPATPAWLKAEVKKRLFPGIEDVK